MTAEMRTVLGTIELKRPRLLLPCALNIIEAHRFVLAFYAPMTPTIFTALKTTVSANCVSCRQPGTSGKKRKNSEVEPEDDTYLDEVEFSRRGSVAEEHVVGEEVALAHHLLVSLEVGDARPLRLGLF